jgi:serine/threonine-protein kinase HipA
MLHPADAKSVEAADVYKGERLAGSLRRTGQGGTAFTYNPAYLAAGAPPVASTLPLRPEPYVTGSGAAPAFFAGLLPEGARLRAVIAAVKTSPDDELSLLLAVASDAVGDVGLVAEGSPAPAVAHSDLPADPNAVSFREMFERSVDPAGDHLDRAVPGVQEKLSSAVVWFPVAHQEGPSILKLNSPGLPLIVANEAFCLALARHAGFQVPDFEVVHDRDGQSGLLVRRFDRAVDGGRLRPIAQEDACQFLGRWPADKYRVTVNDVAARVAALASSPQLAVLNLIEQVAFSWMVGNGDLHAKNFSLQWLPNERLVVPTPVYDIVSTLPYPLDQKMALQVDGRDANLQGRLLTRFALRFDIPDTMVRRRLGELIDRVEPRVSDFGAVGFPDEVAERVIAAMERRITALKRFQG